jgi:cell division septation protein DedD
MAENRKGKGKRYYFSRAQMILLGGGFTVASAIIFLLGMTVGKAIEERKIIRAEEPLVKIPVKPGPSAGGSAAASQPKEELTFYDTLTKPAADTSVSGEEKSNGPQAQEKTSRTEARETTRKGADTPLQTVRKPAEKAGDAGDKTALKKPLDKEKPAEKPAKTGEKEKVLDSPAAAAVELAASKDPGRWTVQVNAFPDERSAKTWVDRLKNRGYNAYVSEVLNKGQTWYRVRVGRFHSREEAEKIEEALRTKENLPNAFATGRVDG